MQVDILGGCTPSFHLSEPYTLKDLYLRRANDLRVTRPHSWKTEFCSPYSCHKTRRCIKTGLYTHFNRRGGSLSYSWEKLPLVTFDQCNGMTQKEPSPS